MNDREGPRTFGPRDPYAPPEQRRKFEVPIVASDVVKLSEKVMFPVQDYPRYNFVGGILGPKGSILKGLQATTKCKMSILGRGSTRDKKSEEELSKSDDSQHEHLKEPLHVLIQVQAPQIEAHRRLAAALREVYQFMVPPNDDTMMPDQIDARPPPYRNEHEGGRPGGSRDDPYAPIVRVGIPPPGALILGEQSPRTPRNGGRPPQRESRRGPHADGYDAPPPRDGYSENRDGYNKFSRAGEKRGAPGYSEIRDGFFARPGENRNAPSNEYSSKRYRDSY